MQITIKNGIKFGIVSDRTKQELTKGSWRLYEDFRNVFAKYFRIWVMDKQTAKGIGLIK